LALTAFFHTSLSLSLQAAVATAAVGMVVAVMAAGMVAAGMVVVAEAMAAAPADTGAAVAVRARVVI
jgi:hypothetical protein